MNINTELPSWFENNTTLDSKPSNVVIKESNTVKAAMGDKKPSHYKIDAIPTWNGKCDSDTIKEVCVSVTLAKEMLDGELTDKEIIFSFLSKNEKMSIYDILSNEAANCVKTFVTEMKRNFCFSEAKIFRDLQKIAQRPDENSAVFFHRVVRQVHCALKKEVPTLENVEPGEDIMIRHFFMQGLKSRDLRNHLQNEYSKVTLKELPQYALDYYGTDENINRITHDINRVTFNDRSRSRSKSGISYDRDRSRRIRNNSSSSSDNEEYFIDRDRSLDKRYRHRSRSHNRNSKRGRSNSSNRYNRSSSRNRDNEFNRDRSVSPNFCIICGRRSHRANRCYDRRRKPRD